MSADYEFHIPDVNTRQPMPRVRFYIEPIKHDGRSQEEGRPIYIDQEMVSIINPGSKDEFVKKVDDKTRSQYAQHYEHWKKTQKELVEGTPLSQLTFMGPAQVEELRFFNVLSVEQLAAVPDSTLHKLGHGARDLRAKAQAYLEAARDSALTQKQAAEIQKLKDDNAALQKQILEIGMRFDQLMKEKGNG